MNVETTDRQINQSKPESTVLGTKYKGTFEARVRPLIWIRIGIVDARNSSSDNLYISEQSKIVKLRGKREQASA